MNYAIAVVAFGLYFFLRKKGGGASKGGAGKGGKGGAGGGGGKKWLAWVLGSLALLGSASIAATGLGDWIARMISAAAGGVAGLVGFSGALLLGAIVLIMTVITLWDICVDRQVDKPAMTGLFVLPLLFLAAAGPLADSGAALTGTVADAGSNGIGGLIGG